MTTGARRGELCALRWDRIELDRAALSVRSSSAQEGSRTWEEDTKTHQQRRIALDATTVGLRRAYRRDCDEMAASLGLEVSPSARLFSASPDHSTWLVPSSVSQRFARMCARLGRDRNIHELRHNSATELISAGVDIRTVAGRLGHGGGGSTTLRTYAAWVSEADQRAAGTFDNHMPALPVNLDDLDEVVIAPGAETIRAAAAPYRRIGRPTGSHNVRGISHRRPPAHSGRTRRPLPGGSEYRTPGHLRTQHQRSSHRQPGRRTTVA